MLFVFLIAALCIGADQLTKYLAVAALYPDGSVDVIPGILRFTYVENRGAAFGSLSDERWIFLVFSTVLIIVLIGYTVWKKPAGWLERISIGLLIGGGIGNMIDRTLMGYVVDFVDFRLINFAVFNVADIFVCVGCGLMFLWLFKFAEFDDEKKPEKKSAVTESAEESDDASDR